MMTEYTPQLLDRLRGNIEAQKAALMLRNRKDMDDATYAVLAEWYASSSLSDPFHSQKEQWERDFKSQGIFRRIQYLAAALFNDPIRFAEP